MQIDSSKVLNWINSKWSGRPCPMCGSRHLDVVDKAFQLMEFHKGAALAVGGPTFPVVPIICTNCGNILFVSAIMTGVVETAAK